MSYSIAFAPAFLAELTLLSIESQELVLDEIDRLADHPVGLSRPVDVIGATYQIYDFFGTAGPIELRFEVRFQYAQDEQSLYLWSLVIEPTTT